MTALDTDSLGTPDVPASDAARRMLPAAAQIHSGEGVATLDARRVAEEIGVSPKMVHCHFGDKDGLPAATLFTHSSSGAQS